MKHHLLPQVLRLGIVAFAMAWSVGCGDININGPDWNWPEWPWPEDPADYVNVLSEWRGVVAPGQRIEIKGVFGSIRAARAAGTEVVVTAMKTGRPGAVDDVTIEAVPHGDGVTICAVYPDVAGWAPNSCEPGEAGNMSTWDGGRGLVRVTFTVELPDGVILVGKTMTGDIEATGLRSDAFLRTLSGDIRVSTTGLATGTTTNGGIVASIGLPDWGRDLEFSALNGDVHVTIPATTNAEVWATTQSGRVDSDFPLSRVLPGDLRGTLGSGGPTLRLRTLSGDIALRSGSQATALGAARDAGGE